MDERGADRGLYRRCALVHEVGDDRNSRGATIEKPLRCFGQRSFDSGPIFSDLQFTDFGEVGSIEENLGRMKSVETLSNS